jgi:hypothetical protein
VNKAQTLLLAGCLTCSTAYAGEPVKFDAVRGSIGAGAVVPTIGADSSPASFDAYAALETGWVVHHVGFWTGLSVLFPATIGFCTSQSTNIDCASRVMDIQTGLDYSAPGFRAGAWVGIGASFLPSAGLRTEWLPIRIGTVGRVGGALKVAVLSFPPVTSSIPAVEVDAGLRFDLWPAEQ